MKTLIRREIRRGGSEASASADAQCPDIAVAYTGIASRRVESGF
jgi:hypothetical protein